MKQAEKLPAWTHPDNDQPPEKADGLTFRPCDESWIDPYDGEQYIANGYGFFEGFNGRLVREHGEHTLIRAITSDEQGRFMTLKAAAIARDLQPLLDEQLTLHGIDVEYCEIKKAKSTKVPQKEVLKVTGLTEEITDQIFKEFSKYAQENLDPDFYFGVPGGKGEKDREEFEQIMETIEKEFSPIEAWNEVKEKAKAAGIADERLIALHKQTATPGLEPEFSEESMALLNQFVDNEIDVMAQKSAGQLSLLAAPAAPPTPQEAVDEIVEKLTEKPVEFVEAPRLLIHAEDGTILDAETGEVVGLNKEREEELAAEVPAEFVQPETNEFVIDSKEKASWLTGKIRQLQKDIERAMSDKKEYVNQCEVIKRRIESKLAGYRWKFGRQLHQWAIDNAKKKANGDIVKSIVLPEGTVTLKATPVLVCTDEIKFKEFWEILQRPESVEELAMYPHTVKRTMSDSQKIEALQMGLELPGYGLLESNPIGDWDVTKSPEAKPRKKKGAVEVQEGEAEGDE